jgi:hypothetical protein
VLVELGCWSNATRQTGVLHVLNGAAVTEVVAASVSVAED